MMDFRWLLIKQFLTSSKAVSKVKCILTLEILVIPNQNTRKKRLNRNICPRFIHFWWYSWDFPHLILLIVLAIFLTSKWFWEKKKVKSMRAMSHFWFGYLEIWRLIQIGALGGQCNSYLILKSFILAVILQALFITSKLLCPKLWQNVYCEYIQ